MAPKIKPRLCSLTVKHLASLAPVLPTSSHRAISPPAWVMPSLLCSFPTPCPPGNFHLTPSGLSSRFWGPWGSPRPPAWFPHCPSSALVMLHWVHHWACINSTQDKAEPTRHISERLPMNICWFVCLNMSPCMSSPICAPSLVVNIEYDPLQTPF